jgi:glycosyltransferase involved in cell wall biosynthesis
MSPDDQLLGIMRLVFHIGLHKTGSTFLQGALHRNAPELHRRGIHYAPAGGLAAHHDIAWAMLRGDFRPFTRAISDPRIGACDTVVLSSEDFESLLILPQFAQEAEQLARAAGYGRIEWHASLRRQDEYFWSLYSEMSKHVFVDPVAIFHEVMQRGYLYLEGADGDRAGSPFWHFCFDWSLVEEFASLMRGETRLYSFAAEVPLPGQGFIAHLTGGLWAPPPGPAQQHEVNARLSDPEVHENYVLRFIDPLEDSGRDMLAAIIRRRARLDSQLKTLINEQLQARYLVGNQGIFERFAGSRSTMSVAAEERGRELQAHVLRTASNLVVRGGGPVGDVSMSAVRAVVPAEPPRRHPRRHARTPDRDPLPPGRLTNVRDTSYRLRRNAPPPRCRNFDADKDGSDTRMQPPDAMRVVVSMIKSSLIVAALAHVEPRSRQTLARSLNRLGRLISRFGRLITRFGEELEIHSARVALRSTAALVKSHVRSGWARVRQRRAIALAQARKWVTTKLPMPSRRGVLFIGYVEANLGLAESLRGLISATAERPVEYGIYPFRVGVETRLIEQFMPEKFDLQHRYDVNIIEVAADQVPAVFGTLDSRLLASSYNVLRTYWELSRAPQEWSAMLRGVQEIWAPNEFVGAAFRRIFSGPITIIPPCVATQEGHYPSAAEFGIESGRFYFLFSFDFYSFPHRKNPLGVLNAFRSAFPDLNENVGLIIKSTGSELHQPDVWKQMQAIVQKDARIKIIHGTLSRQSILGLIRACDCYVSLHRAEGFGLGMAEAMSFGKIVIGTDYSGSTDFLSAETGFPVAYDLRAVKPHEYVFWAEDQVWAEPNMDAAIAAFRLAFNDTEARTRKAAAGKAFVDRKYSRAAVGAAVEQRIAEISRQYAGRSPLLRIIGGRGRPRKDQHLGLSQLGA